MFPIFLVHLPEFLCLTPSCFAVSAVTFATAAMAEPEIFFLDSDLRLYGSLAFSEVPNLFNFVGFSLSEVLDFLFRVQ
ncbi:hypothetical protein Nepgr_027994 [Nepenthes gracilis]|uniref:Secreted protein n=1 Tax=Nepenthes gracilis TaxID=150966 RepID=A0AAD3TCC4_NEPGR|nr:hypothetical protein Nepgr_027994 [Nepenthes gracilis]